MNVTIEAAAPADVPAIAGILNDAILNSVAAWRETPMSEAEMTAWFDERTKDFAVLVARGEGGDVLGYASYGAFRAYSGYRRTVEHSVYVRQDARGQGAGKALLARLVERARSQGLHVMVGALEAGNQPSAALHAKLGFTETARMPEVGRKFDRWLTLVFVQKLLSRNRRNHPGAQGFAPGRRGGGFNRRYAHAGGFIPLDGNDGSGLRL